MSDYYNPAHGNNNTRGGMDGNLDPANSFQGNSSPTSLSGVEIAIIIGAIVAFLSVVGGIFFYRQREARLAAALQSQDAALGAELGKQGEDASALAEGSHSQPQKPNAAARSWSDYLPGRKQPVTGGFSPRMPWASVY